MGERDPGLRCTALDGTLIRALLVAIAIVLHHLTYLVEKAAQEVIFQLAEVVSLVRGVCVSAGLRAVTLLDTRTIGP